MSRIIDEQDCKETIKAIETVHCGNCKVEPEYCKYCIYQNCREAFDFMSKHMEKVEEYYEYERLRYYKSE